MSRKDNDFGRELFALRELVVAIRHFLDRILAGATIHLTSYDTGLYLRACDRVSEILSSPLFANLKGVRLPFKSLREVELQDAGSSWPARRDQLTEAIMLIEEMIALENVRDETLSEADSGVVRELTRGTAAQVGIAEMIRLFVFGHAIFAGFSEKMMKQHELIRRGFARLPNDIDERTAIPPVLVLRDLPEIERNKNAVARLCGFGPFNGVKKNLGSRELFFLQLLFESRETQQDGDISTTVVSKAIATESFTKWVDAGHLKFTGRDQARPDYRVQKMWVAFVQNMKRVKKLETLFTRLEDEEVAYYCMNLDWRFTQNLIVSLQSLFRQSDRSGAS